MGPPNRRCLRRIGIEADSLNLPLAINDGRGLNRFILLQRPCQLGNTFECRESYMDRGDAQTIVDGEHTRRLMIGIIRSPPVPATSSVGRQWFFHINHQALRLGVWCRHIIFHLICILMYNFL